MRRTMLLTSVIGILIFMNTPGVMAAANKPPKSVCYEMTAGGGTLDGGNLVLAIKYKGMKIKDIDSTVKFYDILGAYASPLIGRYGLNGTMWYEHGGYDRFRGVLTGQGTSSTFSCGLAISDSEKSAFCYGDTTYSLTEVDCRSIDIDYSVDAASSELRGTDGGPY